LPGLGAAAGAGAIGGAMANRLPNQGARVQDRMADRPSVADRRDNLGDRMQNGREDWQQHRQDMQNDRQDWRNQNREDWQNWAGNYHNNWYHGSWYPGAGWGYMWDNYPVAAAIGLTAWGVNRIGYGWGYWGYSNPYYYSSGSYGYDYSQPLVVYNDNSTTTTVTEPAATTTAPTSEPQPTDAGMAAFNEARAAFYDGDYTAALAKLDTTLKTMPRYTVVHEFRSLVLFALKKYPESAAAIYAVLSAGPGWNWTTMISLYGESDRYTKQLRELEEFAKANPKSADARFLLGYHYQTCGHNDNAAKQYKLAQNLLPDDKLLKQLVAMTAPPDASKKTDTPPTPTTVPSEKVLKSEQFVGTWNATSQGATFQLDLTKEGEFTWTYSRGKDKQSVKGVFAVDQNNLALETNDGGGTMLAEVDFADPSQFKFKMIGDAEKDPGLNFKKS
jgi:tetratricopeptide (TPR) repeat protein